jgi:hypothetical protein
MRSSAQRRCLLKNSYAAWRMPSAAAARQVGEVRRITPQNWGVTNHCRPVNYLGKVAAMFTTLAFFLIAVLLMLGVIADSLWRRFQRR